MIQTAKELRDKYNIKSTKEHKDAKKLCELHNRKYDIPGVTKTQKR